MSVIRIPENYTPKLGIYDTQAAIELIKRSFIERLSEALNLHRVTAPLFVKADTGLNDNLNGFERPVSLAIALIKSALFILKSPSFFSIYKL